MNRITCLVESKPVKQRASCTMILSIWSKLVFSGDIEWGIGPDSNGNYLFQNQVIESAPLDKFLSSGYSQLPGLTMTPIIKSNRKYANPLSYLGIGCSTTITAL